jgi:hypothetical protein
VFGAVSATLAALAMSAGPALADPPAETYPALAGTGSDTTQYVLNGLAGVIPAIGSYDAIDPSTGLPGGAIQTREDGPSFARPNGSSNGIKALTGSVNGAPWQGTVITGQLDFARSSSSPSQPGSDLTFIPFALDAVSYAFSAFGSASVPTYLTIAELADIYTGDTTTYVDLNGVTRNYVPLLPQAGSGTRAFFLSSLGLTEGDVAWITSPTVQENDGSEIDAIGEIVPFSVASWIAQFNGVVPQTILESDVNLGALDDEFGVTPPIDGGVLNPDFPFTRLVFNVVETARLAGISPADVLLQNTFMGSSSSVCQAAATITEYGFATIPNCGDTSTYKSGYVQP